MQIDAINNKHAKPVFRGVEIKLVPKTLKNVGTVVFENNEHNQVNILLGALRERLAQSKGLKKKQSEIQTGTKILHFKNGDILTIAPKSKDIQPATISLTSKKGLFSQSPETISFYNNENMTIGNEKLFNKVFDSIIEFFDAPPKTAN